jgi:hypothetical protein
MGGNIHDEQAGLRYSAGELFRRLSVTPSPGHPVLTHDVLGGAEILCLEGVRYFESLLPTYACASQKIGS